MGFKCGIVGLPNVGKSTLFNRIVKQREAIVDSVSGVTRDRHYGKGDWNGKEFSLIDTGGYVVGSEDIFELEIDKQVELAIDEADAIIFMVDVETGVTGMDEDVAKLLRKVEKPVFLVVNKVDKENCTPDEVQDKVFDLMFNLDASEEQLDFPTVFGSAKNGWMSLDHNNPTDNIIPLLDSIVEHIPAPKGAP